MSLATESAAGAELTERYRRTSSAQLEAAGHHLLEMFVAVCGAPDDAETETQADEAMAAVAALVAARHSPQ